MMPSFFTSKDLELILFGGKGGSGKTTTTAASGAYHWRAGKRVLLISIDPAHSLGDSMEMKLSSAIQEVPGHKGLFAMEMDAQHVLAQFKERYQAPIEKAIERGTYIDHSDIENLFSLSLPGLDEIAAILEIARLIKRKEFDIILVDTAPTGHTLVLLDLPKTLHKWMEILFLMQSKHRFMVRKFTGTYKNDDVDNFLKELGGELKYLSLLLTDHQKTQFVPVTTLDSLSVLETEQLLLELKRHRIKVQDIVINRVSQKGDCPFCREQFEEGEKQLASIKSKFSRHALIRVPLFPYEIQGYERLEEYMTCLEGKTAAFMSEELPSISGEQAKTVLQTPWLFPPEGIRFIFMGGKGGVGKTTIAAATGLHLAQRHPEKKVLIVSIDPTPSLYNAFRIQGECQAPVRIADNLHIFEINGRGLFLQFQQVYQKHLEDTFTVLLRNGLDVKFDKEIMRELIHFSPPGIEEILALIELTDRAEESYDLCIVDTSATGHMLRLMELPAVISTWNNAFMRMLLKYRVHSLTLKERLLQFARKTKKIEHLLKEPLLTRFVVVAIAEALSIVESERLISSLRDLSIPCRDVVFNFLVPETSCAFHRIKRREQLKRLEEFSSRLSGDLTITGLSLEPGGIEGPGGLDRLSRSLFLE